MFDTRNSLALLLVRFPLGLDMFVHGYQKVTHIPGTMRYYDGLGVPHPLAWLTIIAEFCGGLGLMIGMLSRIAAFGVGCTMVVAVFLRHLPYGYLMNWHGGLPRDVMTGPLCGVTSTSRSWNTVTPGSV